jgi:hypothetical protein
LIRGDKHDVEVSNGEKMRRKPLRRWNSRSISLRGLYVIRRATRDGLLSNRSASPATIPRAPPSWALFDFDQRRNTLPNHCAHCQIQITSFGLVYLMQALLKSCSPNAVRVLHRYPGELVVVAPGTRGPTSLCCKSQIAQLLSRRAYCSSPRPYRTPPRNLPNRHSGEVAIHGR